jgi:hypothetical protein
MIVKEKLGEWVKYAKEPMKFSEFHMHFMSIRNGKARCRGSLNWADTVFAYWNVNT